MEPFTLLMLAVQHSLIGLVKHKARQAERDYRVGASAVFQGVATKVGAEAAIESLKKLGPKVAIIPARELIGIGEMLFEILQDVSKHRRDRAEINDLLVCQMKAHGLEDQAVWVCPRSHEEVKLHLQQHKITISCSHLMSKPPLGCRISQRRIALATLAVLPIAPVILIGKALWDFGRVSLGQSLAGSYGYCSFADEIACL